MSKTYNSKDCITGKLIIHAELKTLSPVLVGRGEGDMADIEIMRLPNDRPYIPGSSFAGALQHYFDKWKIAPGENDKKFSKSATVFWGSEQKKQKENEPKNENNGNYQSHIIFDDLLTVDDEVKNKIVRRDGIKIDNKKGITVKGAKYDFELLEPGVTFHLRAEVTIRKEPDVLKDFKNYTEAIAAIITDDNFRLGAQTNNGFGRIQCEYFKVWNFEFPGQCENWIQYLKKFHEKTTAENEISIWSNDYYQIRPDITPLIDLPAQPLTKRYDNRPKPFTIKAVFELKSAVIIGSYGIDKEAPDKVHLKSNNKNIITGKAIKGTLWHRGLKILKTLDIANPENELEKIMGFVDEEKKKAKKGKLRVEEKEIEKPEVQTQTRIKIDRFTGGTISGALFSSAPVWKGADTKVYIEMTLADGFEPAHPILLMHLLKDLWTEDLAIGGEKNVGRGVLTGKKAIVTYENNTLEIEQTEVRSLKITDKGLRSTLDKWEKHFNSLPKAATA